MPGPFGSGRGPNFASKGIAAMLGLVTALTAGYYFSVGGGSTGGLLFTEGAAAGTPAAGEQVVYAKSGGLYVKNSSGTENQLDASGISGLTTGRIPRAASATTISNGSLNDDGAGTLSMPDGAAGQNGTAFALYGSTAGSVTADHGKSSGSIDIHVQGGGNGDGTNKNGGAAGGLSLNGETGGNATGTGTGGAGTDVLFAAGYGGDAAGAGGTAGRGGRISYNAGVPGAANGGTAGAYGWHAFTGKAVITGQDDAVQLTVKGNATQTNNIFEVQASDASKKVTVASDGSAGFPYIFRVSGTTAAATSNDDSSYLFYGGIGGGQGGIFMARQIILAWRDAAAVGTGADGACLSFTAANVLRTTDRSGATETWIQQTPARRRRAATQTVTDSTTLAADDTLSISIIAGRKYSGKLCYYFTTTVNSSGVKVDLAGGTGTFTSFEGCGKIYSTSAGTFLSAVRMSAANTAVGFTATGTTAYVEIDFSFVCNAAGTFKPQFAQNAETGAAESVVAGTNSTLVMEDMP